MVGFVCIRDTECLGWGVYVCIHRGPADDESE